MTPRARHLVVVIVTHNSADIIGGCLRTLPAGLAGIEGWELVIVDNGSTDATLERVGHAEGQAHILRQPDNRGYAAAINAALRDRGHRVGALGGDDAVLVLNPDVRLHPGCARALLAALDEPGAGIAVPRLLDGDGGLLHSLRRSPSVTRAVAEALIGGHRAGRLGLGETITAPAAYRAPRVADWATGAAMLISGRCLAAVGEWDESYFLYSEETDFALRARDAGFRVRYTPDASATHLGGHAHVQPALWALLARNRVRSFRRRHRPVHAALFGGAVLLNELVRAPVGPTHRAAVAALISPSAPVVPKSAEVVEKPVDWVCFSGQDWWYHNRGHSDFQLMLRLARDRKVLLVNSLGMRFPVPGRTSMPLRRVARKLRSTAKVLRRPVPDLPDFAVLSPILLPFYAPGPLQRLSAGLVRLQVRAACRHLGIDEPAVMVTLPTAWPVVAPLRRTTLVFNRCDKHSAFADSDPDVVAAHEDALLRQADHVVYASRALLAEERAVAGPRGRFIDHGVDLDLFGPRDQTEEPPDLRAIPRPRIGYFGGLNAFQLDFDLLARLADEIEGAQLVLIGAADTSIRPLTRRANVWHLGPRPHEQIPAYGSGFDVAIMPWLHNDWIQHCNPIKLKEYLALGLPVVSTRFPEIERYADWVSIADDADAFVAAVDDALSDGGRSTPPRRRAAVESSSWSAIAGRLSALVDSRSDTGSARRAGEEHR
jgi:GT2 family glycosyltransferase